MGRVGISHEAALKLVVGVWDIAICAFGGGMDISILDSVEARRNSTYQTALNTALTCHVLQAQLCSMSMLRPCNRVQWRHESQQHRRGIGALSVISTFGRRKRRGSWSFQNPHPPPHVHFPYQRHLAPQSHRPFNPTISPTSNRQLDPPKISNPQLNPTPTRAPQPQP